MSLQGLLCCQVPSDEGEGAARDNSVAWILTMSTDKSRNLEDVVSLTQEESLLSGSSGSGNNNEPDQHGFDFLPLVPFLSLSMLTKKVSSKDSGDAEIVSSSIKQEATTTICLPKGIPGRVQFTEHDQEDLAQTSISEAFDPTVPLRYGKNLDSLLVSPELAAAAHQLFTLFKACRKDPSDTATTERMYLFLGSHPETCQVRYPHPSPRQKEKQNRSGMIYSTALAVAAAIGSLQVVQAAYAAYPEAIGMPDRAGYLPLHYAAMHNHTPIVEFLLNVFPEATRRTTRDDAMTPLHLACWSPRASDTSYDKAAPSSIDTCIEALVGAHHAGVHTPDANGRTAQHYWVQNPAVTVRGIRLLTPSLQLRTNRLETPLHLAVESSAMTTDILDALHAIDEAWIEQLDDRLHTCLHRAVAANQSWTAVQWLLEVYPTAVHQEDAQGRRPQELVTDTTHPNIRSRLLQGS